MNAVTLSPRASAPVTHRPPAKTGVFYLVGEAERSSPLPPSAPGRTSIMINGRLTPMRGTRATYEQLLRIAYPDTRRGELRNATVTWRNPSDNRQSGLLSPGDVIPLSTGLLVNVNATYAS